MPTTAPPLEHPLKALLRRRRLGLAPLALLSGVAYTSLSAMARGRRPLSRRLLDCLAEMGEDTDALCASVEAYERAMRERYQADLAAGRRAPSLVPTAGR